MIFYTYTYKGPKYHLLGCYITSVIAIESTTSDEEMEELIPKSKLNIYNPRKDINIYTRSICYDYSNLTTAKQLNKEGSYALLQNKIRLLNGVHVPNMYVKSSIATGCWQERLSIIYTIDMWRRYMTYYTNYYLSSTKFTYEKLEKDIVLHKIYLKRLRVLPKIYLWYKVMNLFKDDTYKPLWYKKEIESYYKLIGE